MTEPAQEVRAPGSSRLPTLTTLRALAALAVFGYHAGRITGWEPLKAISGTGYAGVAFFFVLSGFVLSWSFHPLAATVFFHRRFARVYPLHLVTALAVALVFGFPELGVAVANLLLLQAWWPTEQVAFALNGASWSLSAEAFFYACFPLLAAYLAGLDPRRRALLAGLLWSACSLAVVVLAHEKVGVASLVFPPVRLGEFVLGIVLGLAVKGGWRPPVGVHAAVLVVAAAFVADRALDVPAPLSDVTLALPFALLIAAAAGADADGRPLLPWRVAIFAGEVSYAFYLVHERVITKVAEHLDGRAAVALSLLASAGLAVALHLAVERPARRLLTTRRRAEVPA